jgi:hypothetical protein
MRQSWHHRWCRPTSRACAVIRRDTRAARRRQNPRRTRLLRNRRTQPATQSGTLLVDRACRHHPGHRSRNRCRHVRWAGPSDSPVAPAWAGSVICVDSILILPWTRSRFGTAKAELIVNYPLNCLDNSLLIAISCWVAHAPSSIRISVARFVSVPPRNHSVHCPHPCRTPCGLLDRIEQSNETPVVTGGRGGGRRCVYSTAIPGPIFLPICC